MARSQVAGHRQRSIEAPGVSLRLLGGVVRMKKKKKKQVQCRQLKKSQQKVVHVILPVTSSSFRFKDFLIALSFAFISSFNDDDVATVISEKAFVK